MSKQTIHSTVVPARVFDAQATFTAAIHCTSEASPCGPSGRVWDGGLAPDVPRETSQTRRLGESVPVEVGP